MIIPLALYPQTQETQGPLQGGGQLPLMLSVVLGHFARKENNANIAAFVFGNLNARESGLFTGTPLFTFTMK